MEYTEFFGVVRSWTADTATVLSIVPILFLTPQWVSVVPAHPRSRILVSGTLKWGDLEVVDEKASVTCTLNENWDMEKQKVKARKVREQADLIPASIIRPGHNPSLLYH